MALKNPLAAQPPSASQPMFRSGAVARIAHMPVPTLRIWEQRYRAVGPITAPSGHRLYSAADVQRVLLLRQLTGQGHAIGSIAALDVAQLQQVANTQGASTHAPNTNVASTPAGKDIRPARRLAALRLIVVGRALALRLQRAAVVQRLGRGWKVTQVFESLAEATRAASGAEVDLLLWQAPGLQASLLPEMQAAQGAWRARQVAVVYRFGGAAAASAFATAGAVLVREPADDDALGAWVASLHGPLASEAGPPDADETTAPAALSEGPDWLADEAPPRRYDDAALTTIAGLSPTIACECPRYVAELLIQLSNFETYSADCANRNPADAQLHAYLQRVASASRGLFETALERVARHEGLTLP